MSKAIFQSLRTMDQAQNPQQHSLELEDYSWWCLIFTNPGSTSAATHSEMGMLAFENCCPCYGNMIPLLGFGASPLERLAHRLIRHAQRPSALLSDRQFPRPMH